MPVAYLDVPSSLAVDMKKKLVKDVAEFIHQAYMSGLPSRSVSTANWVAQCVRSVISSFPQDYR